LQGLVSLPFSAWWLALPWGSQLPSLELSSPELSFPTLFLLRVLWFFLALPLRPQTFSPPVFLLLVFSPPFFSPLVSSRSSLPLFWCSSACWQPRCLPSPSPLFL